MFLLIIKYCQSGKEKTTANGIRALGYLKVEASAEVEKILIEALSNRSPKIVWNSCIAISKFVERGSGMRLKSGETTEKLFSIISGSANLKSRIQAAAALMTYSSLKDLGGKEILNTAWESLNECVSHKTQFIGTVMELKYFEKFESLWIDLWVIICGFTESCKEMRDFVDLNSNLFLQNFVEYLRKELKVPTYSEIFDDTNVFN